MLLMSRTIRKKMRASRFGIGMGSRSKRRAAHREVPQNDVVHVADDVLQWPGSINDVFIPHYLHQPGRGIGDLLPCRSIRHAGKVDVMESVGADFEIGSELA